MDTAVLKPRIVTMAEWTAVGLMQECPNYDCDGISELWARLNGFLGRADATRHHFGISMPANGRARGICYWAAVKLMPGEAIPAGLGSIAIPAKRYACWKFHDEPAKLPGEMGEIFCRRLLAAGLHQDPDWIAIERYPPDWLDVQSGKFHCDLMVAIS